MDSDTVEKKVGAVEGDTKKKRQGKEIARDSKFPKLVKSKIVPIEGLSKT